MQLATANPSPVCHFPNACPRSSAANTAMRWSTVISSDIFDLLSTASLRTTAVMHEAFLRLVGIEIEWRDRAHFFAKFPPGPSGGRLGRARPMRRLLGSRRGAASLRLKRFSRFDSGAGHQVMPAYENRSIGGAQTSVL